VILKNVDRFVEVTDDEIRAAMRAVYEDTHNIAEGAAAAAIAATIKERDKIAGQRVGVVLTGGNVDREAFLEALNGELNEA
jgi:threonine dehydratase